MDIGGLGLQIVYSVVQYQLNGIIKLERNPGVKWLISVKDNMYSERV
jgi:two-component sensor histidine kinase